MNLYDIVCCITKQYNRASMTVGDYTVPISIEEIVMEEHPYGTQELNMRCTIMEYLEKKAVISSSNHKPNTIPTIKNVIFNDPATIVFWSDDTKTVAKTHPGDKFDPEKGLAMAISKKALGNKGDYYKMFDKWLSEYSKYTITDELQTLINQWKDVMESE